MTAQDYGPLLWLLAGGAGLRPAPPQDLGSFTLMATGDIMMHEAVKQAAAVSGFPALFAQAAPLLKGADLAFGNLETPVAPHANHGTRSFVFNAPPELLPSLRAAGFGAVSFANNHAYDQGPAGVVETLDNLSDAGLIEIGAGRNRAEAEAPVVYRKNGISLGLIGCTARFNQDLNQADPTQPYVVPADSTQVAARVAALAALVDAVVVSVHWGNEYQPEPDEQQIDFAKRLVASGALLVLGSHPHVLQRIEVYPRPDGTPALVAFSLGNFISNQSRDYVLGATPPASGDTRDGVLLEVLFRKRKYLGDQVVTEIAGVEGLPLWTDNNALQRKVHPALEPAIRVVDETLELKTLGQELAGLALDGGMATATAPRALELQRRIELLSTRKARVAERLGNEYVPDR